MLPALKATGLASPAQSKQWSQDGLADFPGMPSTAGFSYLAVKILFSFLKFPVEEAWHMALQSGGEFWLSPTEDQMEAVDRVPFLTLLHHATCRWMGGG